MSGFDTFVAIGISMIVLIVLGVLALIFYETINKEPNSPKEPHDELDGGYSDFGDSSEPNIRAFNERLRDEYMDEQREKRERNQ